MDGVSLNTDPVVDDDADADEFEIEGDCGMAKCISQSGVIQGENPLPPVVGMEFDSYEDVYYFYNCYAKEQGFGVRVSNTWYRKTKERYRGKLSCSSAGFKKKSEANRPRPETRTGCPAMIKFRLMENKRWRIIEVELDHNHLISAISGKFYKSHKQLGIGTKRALHLDSAEEVQKVRLFRTVVIDVEGNGSVEVSSGEFRSSHNQTSQLRLKDGDAQAIHNYFSHLQLIDPNFFYVVDLNEKGCLRNLFWSNTRSRVAYGYFGDVVAVDTICLTDKYQVPLVSFIGVNHHGQSVLLGCGLLAGDTIEACTWLFRAWLTCMLGRPPQVIITDQCRTLQAAVTDVFPRAFHCLCLPRIMQKVPEKLGGLYEYESIRMALNNAVVESFFDGYLDKHTSLKEFLDKYDQALQANHQLEVLADMESRNSGFMLQSRCYFELQLAKLYTNNVLRKFEREVEGMYSCFCTRQINGEGEVITYMVREQTEVDGNRRECRDFEVLYNATEMEVLCVCGLFNFKGYLCRHALSVLHQNGIEEIPPQYVVSRWRKDIKRSYVLNHSNGGIDINNPVHRYDHLYKCIMQVVEEGRKSEVRYKDTVQALDQILRKLNLVEGRL
ncbi:hypothetical protein Golax_007691 [Gossypium laxum]|uniref:Protein FAR1-RELATED SEQUENCE n=1 Tax=Gossypium laxum TaxID=34288 RepID=A0A7J9A7V8_9ROSI|nr:hypothetical protein [Gossypium laxum]